MKTVAFVPIKLNNERFPGKNLKCFDDGIPILYFFLKKLQTINSIDNIYLYCSSDIDGKYIPEGVEVLSRPSWLDSSDATPQDIIREFMSVVDADIYSVCHCTSPFVSSAHIEKCIDVVKSCRYDSAFTAVKIQKLLWKDNAAMNFDPTRIPRTQDLPRIYAEVSAAYVFTKEVFCKYERRVGVNPFICEVSEIESVDIDYEEDFVIANALYLIQKERNR